MKMSSETAVLDEPFLQSACNWCGTPLPGNHPYPVCESCRGGLALEMERVFGEEEEVT